MRPLSNALFALLLLCACNSNEAGTTTAGSDTATAKAPEKKAPENSISFKADSNTVATTGSNINLSDFRNGAGIALNLTSDVKSKPQVVNITVNATKPGTYPFDGTASGLQTPGKAYGDYMPDGNADKKDHYFFKTGSFTINSIDTTAGLLNASFSGEAKNDKGKTIQITEGKIVNGVMKPGITSF